MVALGWSLSSHTLRICGESSQETPLTGSRVRGDTRICFGMLKALCLLLSPELTSTETQTDFWVILCGLVSHLLLILKTDFNCLKQLGNFEIKREAQVLYHVKYSYRYNQINLIDCVILRNCPPGARLE